MNTRSGTTHANATQRKDAGKNATLDTDRLAITMPKEDSGLSTNATAEDTQRTPSPSSSPIIPSVHAPTTSSNSTLVIGTLATALILSLVGIIILLLRRG
jgi:hypothetical protein